MLIIEIKFLKKNDWKLYKFETVNSQMGESHKPQTEETWREAHKRPLELLKTRIKKKF